MLTSLFIFSLTNDQVLSLHWLQVKPTKAFSLESGCWWFYDNSSTDISSTTVYQRTAQLYIHLRFQQIIIFINSNFYFHYDSFLSIPLPLTLLIIQHIQLASIVA